MNGVLCAVSTRPPFHGCKIKGIKKESKISGMGRPKSQPLQYACVYIANDHPAFSGTLNARMQTGSVHGLRAQPFSHITELDLVLM